MSDREKKGSPSTAERFDEYVLVDRLGRGGMAEVYLAFREGQSGFRKVLVIKRLLRHLHREPETVEMFHDEARIAARLNHPNVIQTNRVGTFGGLHFMETEHLEGQPLSRLLKRLAERGERLPPALAARITSDVLDGLEYTHAATDFDGTPLRVVHRDISPQNIFVTYDGAVKILDFGVAKAKTQQSVTQAGLIKGKFAYMAPEQADGAPTDQRADVWSLGAVLWEALVGARLFKSSNELATLNEALTKSIEPPSALVEDAPETLSDIALRALQRDVDARYQSAAEMRQPLDAWLAGAGTEGTHRNLSRYMRELFADAIEEERARLARYADEVAAAGVGLAAEATDHERRAGAPDEVARPSEPAPRSVRPSRPPPRERTWLVPVILLVLTVLGAAIGLLGPWGD